MEYQLELAAKEARLPKRRHCESMVQHKKTGFLLVHVHHLFPVVVVVVIILQQTLVVMALQLLHLLMVLLYPMLVMVLLHHIMVVMVLLDPLSLPTPLSLLMITSGRHGHGLQLLHLGLCPVLPSPIHLKHLRFTLK